MMTNVLHQGLRPQWLSLMAIVLLGACAATPMVANVDAPRYVQGDRWEYRITDNLRRGAVTQLEVQVMSVSPTTTTFWYSYIDPYGVHSERTDEMDAAGGLIAGSLKPADYARFNPPVKLYQFPLTQGEVWRQTIPTVRHDLGDIPGQILVYGKVQGAYSATVPAGSYDGIELFRILQLDDDQFWRTRTTRRDQVLYSPLVKGVVRETRDASYHDIGGPDPANIRTENTTRELLSFTPGK
jgi:hypothetical protein